MRVSHHPADNVSDAGLERGRICSSRTRPGILQQENPHEPGSWILSGEEVTHTLPRAPVPFACHGPRPLCLPRAPSPLPALFMRHKTPTANIHGGTTLTGQIRGQLLLRTHVTDRFAVMTFTVNSGAHTSGGPCARLLRGVGGSRFPAEDAGTPRQQLRLGPPQRRRGSRGPGRGSCGIHSSWETELEAGPCPSVRSPDPAPLLYVLLGSVSTGSRPTDTPQAFLTVRRAAG